jgi:hypothetical protein
MTTMALGLLLACLLALALTIAGPTSEGVIATRPAEAATPAITVTVACKATPETTRVKNNRSRSITIKTVGSIHEPRSNEPFLKNRTLGPGGVVTFESGYDANQNVLTRQYIYDNYAGSHEGARVGTPVGRFYDRCG